MRKIMCSVKSFITFDFPLDDEYISDRFTTTHDHYKTATLQWSLTATKRKVIADYWFRNVLSHFASIYGLAALFVLLSDYSFNYPFLLSVLTIGLISFSVFVVTHYWPFYYSDFLPKLDTILAYHEQEIQKEEKLEKCRRTQFSIPTLTVIFYIFSKDCNFPFPACNDQSAELLNNIFGSDKDKLKENLRRIYKLSSLSPKEKAEIQKGINLARTFFEALQHPTANPILDNLELRLQKA